MKRSLETEHVWKYNDSNVFDGPVKFVAYSEQMNKFIDENYTKYQKNNEREEDRICEIMIKETIYCIDFKIFQQFQKYDQSRCRLIARFDKEKSPTTTKSPLTPTPAENNSISAEKKIDIRNRSIDSIYIDISNRNSILIDNNSIDSPQVIENETFRLLSNDSIISSQSIIQFHQNALTLSNDKDTIRLKVCDLFGNQNRDKGYIFEKNNALFNTGITLSQKIYQEFRRIFFYQVSFDNTNEVIKFLKDEIEYEKRVWNKSKNTEPNPKPNPNFRGGIAVEGNNESKFNQQAKVYEDILGNHSDGRALEEKILSLYSLEGFVFDSLNPLLDKEGIFRSQLILYYLLMLASFEIVSKKNMLKSASKCRLTIINGEEYYTFFRGSRIAESLLLNEIEALQLKKASKYVFGNEIQFVCCDVEQCKNLLFLDGNNAGLIPVLYNFRIKKSEADRFQNLFCFPDAGSENFYISNNNSQKQVLLCPTSVFEVQKIEKVAASGLQYYEIICEFTSVDVSNSSNVSNTSNNSNNSNPSSKYEFLKSCAEKEIIVCYRSNAGKFNDDSISNAVERKVITLEDESESGDEAVKAISEALSTNTSAVEKVTFAGLKISDAGAEAFAPVLKTNSKIKFVSFQENQIGDLGAKALVDALISNTNSSLEELSLLSNKIGASGAKAFGNYIASNKCSLKKINLSANNLKDEGAKAFALGLQENKSLKQIKLSINQIGKEGVQAIVQALAVKDYFSFQVKSSQFEFEILID